MMPPTLIETEDSVVSLLDDGGGPPSDTEYPDGDWRPYRIPPRSYQTGMLVGIAASSMFFLALISASVVHRGMPGSDWVSPPLPWLLWITSSIAIVSSVTLLRARHFFKSGEYSGFSRWWNFTALLGLIFLAGQMMAWRQLAAAGFYMKSNPSVSFFYVFTVAHGLHLLAGVVALLWIRYRRSLIVSGSTSTSVASLYWHFVTGLWLVLFSFFLIGG